MDVLDIQTMRGQIFYLIMNQRLEDKSLISKYDFYIDWGTIEHVFHAPNYISNIYDLLKIDGYYYGVTPYEWMGRAWILPVFSCIF